MGEWKEKRTLHQIHTAHNKFMNGIDVEQRFNQVTYINRIICYIHFSLFFCSLGAVIKNYS